MEVNTMAFSHVGCVTFARTFISFQTLAWSCCRQRREAKPEPVPPPVAQQEALKAGHLDAVQHCSSDMKALLDQIIWMYTFFFTFFLCVGTIRSFVKMLVGSDIIVIALLVQ